MNSLPGRKGSFLQFGFLHTIASSASRTASRNSSNSAIWHARAELISAAACSFSRGGCDSIVIETPFFVDLFSKLMLRERRGVWTESHFEFKFNLKLFVASRLRPGTISSANGLTGMAPRRKQTCSLSWIPALRVKSGTERESGNGIWYFVAIKQTSPRRLGWTSHKSRIYAAPASRARSRPALLFSRAGFVFEQEWPVDQFDVDATVLNGLGAVRDLNQLAAISGSE
jgi:hypothetical protein